MSNPAPEWMVRARLGLRALLASPQLLAQVHGEVSAFFAAHPEEPRTAQAEEVLTILVFERLTGTAAETKKAA